MQMEMFIWVSGRTIVLMEKASISPIWGLATKENGKMISKMGKGRRDGRMGLYILVIINVEKKKVRGLLNGVMEVHIMGSLKTTILRERAYISGQMDEFIKASGKTIKWKATVFSLGRMDENMRESI
jgi:hypothetical protein